MRNRGAAGLRAVLSDPVGNVGTGYGPAAGEIRPASDRTSDAAISVFDVLHLTRSLNRRFDQRLANARTASSAFR